MKAAILTVGDELLDGYVTDTNSAWLARELASRGVSVAAKASVGDIKEEIRAALARWDGQFDLVLVTGGLGPTHDDVTKLACCEYFKCDLRFDEAYWAELVSRFEARGYDIPENNRSQAEIPTACETLPNPAGTALGMKFRSDATTFILLPGVPREMEAIVTASLLPSLEGPELPLRILRTTGLYESALAQQLGPALDALEGVQVGLLTDVTGVDIRLRAGQTGAAGSAAVDRAADDLARLLGDKIYSTNGDSLARRIGHLLKERGESLAIAESCTGGLAAAAITAEAGSSAWFQGAVVAYGDQSKIDLLGVRSGTLAAHGAVSAEVAVEMASGVRTALHADWGLATTGISGPGGGSQAKPVGLVYLALAGLGATTVREAHLIAEREPHRQAAAQSVLNMLRMELQRHG